MVQKQAVLWLQLGLCLGVVVQTHGFSGASDLHGKISKSAYSSSGECRVQIDRPIVMDKDLLLPVPEMQRNCTFQGVQKGALIFPNPFTFFSARPGVVINLEEVRIVYWRPASFIGMFRGMMEVSRGAKLVVRNVVIEVTLRCLGWLKEELEFMGVSDQQVDLGGYPSNEILFRSLVIDSLSLFNVKCVGVRFPLMKSDWLEPMRYYVETTKQLINSLTIAEGKSEHSTLEVIVVKDIFVAEDDLPEGRPFHIWCKVVMNRQGLGGGTLTLSHSLANGQFIQIEETGKLVLKDIEVVFDNASSGGRSGCTGCSTSPSANLPFGFDTSGPVCQLYIQKSTWRTSCGSIKKIFEEQVVAAAQRDVSLAILNLGEGDSRTIEVLAGATLGICLYQSLVTCNVSSSGRVPLHTSPEEQKSPEPNVDAAPAQVISGNPNLDKRHENSFWASKHIIVGAMVILNTLLLCALSFILCSRCKRQIRQEVPKEKDAGRSDMHGLPRILTPPRNTRSSRVWRTETSNTQLEFLHEIHEEGREIEDEIMELKEQVGSGGYGVVYKAVWHGLPVAVKTVIFEDNKRDSRHKKRAICEAAISSSISHRNLVQTYTYFFEKLPPAALDSQGAQLLDSVHWKMHIVLEFCELGSLSRSVRRGTFVDMDTRAPDMHSILHVAHDIASGMRHLHSRNIVHGDLTARNVLLKREKNCIVGKISDFGLSVKLRRHQSYVSNHRAGTRPYMAPELITSGRLSKSSDLYSYGIILWELYHLSLPTPMAFPHHEARPRFSSSCPMPYVLLCATCLNPKPWERMDFCRVLSILRRLMALLRTNASAGMSTQEINKEWSDLAAGLNPIEVSSLLESHLPNLDTSSIGANSPTMSSTTDTPVFSSLSATPNTLHGHLQSPSQAHTAASKIGSKLEQLRDDDVPMIICQNTTILNASSPSSDDVQNRSNMQQESVTVELTASTDTDMVSFGWVSGNNVSNLYNGM